ncbi:MAG: hypothetical protein HGA80_06335 [Candidatus Omnitrophica bacterium]|nr:hypothetical protein [Candidatus Omnitrophota bacterium]
MYSIRPLQTQDYGGLADFLAAQVGEGLDREFWLERFNWWWEKNSAMRTDIVRGWVLEMPGGKISGFHGQVPLRYHFPGGESMVYAGTTWYVDPSARGYGLGVLLAFIRQKEFLLQTTPADNVGEIVRKMGFRALGQPWTGADHIYPVIKSKAAAFFLLKGVALRLPWVAGMLSWPAAFFLQIVTGVKDKLNAARVQGYAFAEIKAFDARYDQLDKALAGRYAITAVRDAQALNWLIFGVPGVRSRRRVVEVTADGKLCGYAAVKLAKGVKASREYYWLDVMDAVLVTEEAAAGQALLEGLKFLARSSREPVAFIKMAAFEPVIGGLLGRNGFIRKRASEGYFYRDRPGAEAVAENKSFYATPLDGDRAFFP